MLSTTLRRIIRGLEVEQCRGESITIGDIMELVERDKGVGG